MSSQRKSVTQSVDAQGPSGPARKPRAAREGAVGSATSRTVTGEAHLDLEKEAARPEKVTQNVAAPRAGRTSRLGRRAERPSEGTYKQTAAKPVEPGRSSKAPSAKQAREPGSRPPTKP